MINCEVLNQRTSLIDELGEREMILLMGISNRMIVEMQMENAYPQGRMLSRMENQRMRSTMMIDIETSTMKTRAGKIGNEMISKKMSVVQEITLTAGLMRSMQGMRRMVQKFGRNLSHKTVSVSVIMIMSLILSVTVIMIVIVIGNETVIGTEIGTEIGSGSETVIETMNVILTMTGHILMIVVPDTKIAGEGKDLLKIMMTIMILNPRV
jgi:hypothetical protein